MFIFQTIAERFLVIYLKEYLSSLLVGTDLAAYLLVIMKLSRSPRSAHITYSADQLTSRPRFKKHPSLDASPNSQGDFTTRTAIRKMDSDLLEIHFTISFFVIIFVGTMLYFQNQFHKFGTLDCQYLKYTTKIKRYLPQNLLKKKHNNLYTESKSSIRPGDPIYCFPVSTLHYQVNHHLNC